MENNQINKQKPEAATSNNNNNETKSSSPHPQEPVFRSFNSATLPAPQQQNELTPTPIYRGVSDVTNAAKYRSGLGDVTTAGSAFAGFDLSQPTLGTRAAKSDMTSAGGQLPFASFGSFGSLGAPTMSMGKPSLSNMKFFDEPLSLETSVPDEIDFSNNNFPVPDVPSYVEKYTSFTCSSFPNDILKKLVEIFKEYPTIDFELHAAQYSISGTTYRDHASCNFRANVFRGKGHNIVEFQRRSGDAMVFNAFFRHVKSKSAELMEDPNVAVVAADNSNKFVPPSYDIVLDAESLVPLKNMADSPFVDVAREGMKMLAKCSASADNHGTLASLMALYNKFLTAQLKDEELVRYTAFTLANISKNDAVCKELSGKQWLETIVNELRSSENRETCRQLAQVVNNICQYHPDELKSFVPTLKTVLGATADLKLKSVVQSTLGRIDL